MYLFNKIFQYDYELRQPEWFSVGQLLIDVDKVNEIDGILYDYDANQLAVFSYKNLETTIYKGDSELVNEVIEIIKKELDNINITK